MQHDWVQQRLGLQYLKLLPFILHHRNTGYEPCQFKLQTTCPFFQGPSKKMWLEHVATATYMYMGWGRWSYHTSWCLGHTSVLSETKKLSSGIKHFLIVLVQALLGILLVEIPLPIHHITTSPSQNFLSLIATRQLISAGHETNQCWAWRDLLVVSLDVCCSYWLKLSSYLLSLFRESRTQGSNMVDSDISEMAARTSFVLRC